MRHLLLLSLAGVIGLVLPLRAAPEASVPSVSTPFNQLTVSGNACGPAALLNSFRFGNSDWQRAGAAVKGKSDKERILSVIREIGMRPSKHLPSRARWSRRGVGVADLRDMANEMTTGLFFSPLEDEVFFLKPRETPEKLLIRLHKRLSKSVSKGFPPLLSLRRYALRSQKSGLAQWVVIDAHFITVTKVSGKPEKGVRTFTIGYIDPWGGRFCEGSLGIPAGPFMPDSKGNPACPEALLPKTPVGEKLLRKGEKSFISVSAVIGRW